MSTKGDNEEDLEKQYLLKVLFTMRKYKEYALYRLTRAESALNFLDEMQLEYLKSYRLSFDELRLNLNRNQQTLTIFLTENDGPFSGLNIAPEYESDVTKALAMNPVQASTALASISCTSQIPAAVLEMNDALNRTQVVFKQIFREWTSEGRTERDQSFLPILNELDQLYKEEERVKTRVLVPGAGLGRLPYEIAARGYTCQGNDFNAYFLVAANFVLNRCETANSLEICPWLLQTCNNLKTAHMMSIYKFPDILPTIGKHYRGRFSMAAGDFTEVYTEPEQWHCIVTCFFIDCAPNILQCIQQIWRILRRGGYWINLGPLMYHYADIPSCSASIEPSFEVVDDVIQQIGFCFLKKSLNVPTKYCQNPESMSQYEYRSVLFVCEKPCEVKVNYDPN